MIDRRSLLSALACLLFANKLRWVDNDDFTTNNMIVKAYEVCYRFDEVFDMVVGEFSDGRVYVSDRRWGWGEKILLQSPAKEILERMRVRKILQSS